jgi:hypothetical protein
VTALVDGDTTGIGYAQGLAGAVQRPAVILRWPDGWEMEDVVGWTLAADVQRAVKALAAVVVPAPESITALVARLKCVDRALNGLKQDQVAYEAIADVIGEVDACCSRARELLNAMSDVLLGGDSARFTAATGDNPGIRTFKP